MLTQVGHEVAIEQVGEDCFVTICGDCRVIKGANALKLADTMFNKPNTDKYTLEEMWDFGFGHK
jgi:hypothetical protein